MAPQATMEATPAPVDPMVPRPYVVKRVRRETADTLTMEMAPQDGGAPPSFLPGQFNMLYAPGVGESAISISGNPADTGRLVHTVRVVGVVTRALERIGKGGVVGVRGPFGTPWPLAEAMGRDVIVVAGGIGLAPLRPAVFHLLARREEYGRIVLLYGARRPAELLYERDLQHWRQRFDVQVEVTVDRAEGDWRGHVGVVTGLVRRAVLDAADAVALICGPEIMMRFAVIELERYGLLEENLYISLERNMKCGIGSCGHCQFGPVFVCRDGPVFPYEQVSHLLPVREV
jgi:NAD(P)H-flavin reductase